MSEPHVMRSASRVVRAPLKFFWTGAVLATLAASGLSAGAQPAPVGSAASASTGIQMRPGMDHGMERGMGPGAHGGMRHGGAGMGDGMMMFGGSPEHMARAIDRMLDGLNATDAQRTQIKQIAMSAVADMKAERESSRGLRERGLQIFSAPAIDTGAAEQLRQQMLAQHDQASKRMMQAMLDASRVLTAEQRAKAGARLQDMAARMHDRMQRTQADRGMPGRPRGDPDRAPR